MALPIAVLAHLGAALVVAGAAGIGGRDVDADDALAEGALGGGLHRYSQPVASAGSAMPQFIVAGWLKRTSSPATDAPGIGHLAAVALVDVCGSSRPARCATA